jgi:DNA polymerase I
MAKWLLVDGFNLVYRCFYAIPELARSDGFPTNALHGWVKSLWRLGDLERPEGCLVFFDLGGASAREALLPSYKAQRQEMPEALRRQLPYVKSLTRALGFVGIEADGVESDDLLASQAHHLRALGHEVLIASADKDFAQCIAPGVEMLLPPPTANPRLGWRRLDAAGVVEKFGVLPRQIPDYLALVGDSSDNIPGIDGVGPKTAARWLREHGDVEGLISRAAELKPERFREPVIAGAELLRRNLRLTRLDLSLPIIAAQPQACSPGDLFGLLEELEMRHSLQEARERYGQMGLAL